MYLVLLYLHSYLRWAVVLFAAYLIVQAIMGLRSPQQNIKKYLRLFVILFDLQVLVGLALYFFASPMMSHAFQNFGNAMKEPALRFWAVEHPFGMLLSLVLIHVGSLKVKRAADERRHARTVLMFVGLALLLMLMMTPWPFSANPRPFFR